MKFTGTYLKIIIALTLAFGSANVFAQGDSLARLGKRFNAYRDTVLQEKIFAHIDRSFYLTGETMWFRLFYTDATFFRPLNISKVAYVEILDRENKPVSQTKIELTNGGGRGAVFISASLGSGNYTVRAYTSWMKNFSPDLFFQQAITVINPFTKLGLTASKDATYDVQFFPEGGDLISNVDTRVGVRVTDRFGKGAAFTGAIVDDQHDTVVRFRPLKFGLGSFQFTAKPGRSYTAAVSVGHEKYKTYALPQIHTDGYGLHVTDTAGSIGIRVTSPTGTMPLPYCYLFVHTRATHITSRLVYFRNGVANTSIDGASIGEGVTTITILNSSMQPVCERLYFKRPAPASISTTTDQASYGCRKKVNAGFSSDTNVSADLSVSVFKYDSLAFGDVADIRTWFWLTSELNGPIESPAYYLSDGPESKTAIENLMLTHGWSRYKWENILPRRNSRFEFMPEYRGHIVSGKITGADIGRNKRVTAYLSNPDKNIRLYPSRSTADGKVKFELRDFFGPRKLIAQTNTQVDSIYDIQILPPFAQTFSKNSLAAFDLDKNLAALVAQRSLYMQVQNTFHEPKSDRFFVPSLDTTAFYGAPDERYFLDDYTRFPTMEEVMREYVPGTRVRKRKNHFYFMNMDARRQSMFRDNPLVLLDGVPVFDIDKIIAMDPLKVKKLDVLTRKYFLGPLSFDGIVSYTTYTGDLSDIEIDRRALIVDYEGLQVYREFFSPQYATEASQHDRLPDVRNLLYWMPSLKMNSTGKTTAEFYTADMSGKYKIVVQGIDDNGRPLFGSSVFEVKK